MAEFDPRKITEDGLAAEVQQRLESDVRYQYLNGDAALQDALKELDRLRPAGDREAKAKAERDKAVEQRKAAENARAAADRRAEKAEVAAQTAQADLDALRGKLQSVEDSLVSQLTKLMAEAREIV